VDEEGIVMRDGCLYHALGVGSNRSPRAMVLGQTTRVRMCHRDTTKALLEPRRINHQATLAGTVFTKSKKKTDKMQTRNSNLL
jgi:hypothetical protein